VAKACRKICVRETVIIRDPALDFWLAASYAPPALVTTN
jgi:hypothetical protein